MEVILKNLNMMCIFHPIIIFLFTDLQLSWWQHIILQDNNLLLKLK